MQGAVLIALRCGWRTAGKSDVSRNGDLTLDIQNNYPTALFFFFLSIPKPMTVVSTHPYNKIQW